MSAQTAREPKPHICAGGPLPNHQFHFTGSSQRMEYRGGHYQKSATKNPRGQVIWTWVPEPNNQPE